MNRIETPEDAARLALSHAKALEERSEYRIVWAVDLNADTPEEAAREALAMQRDPESIALIFDVFQGGHLVKVVDLGLEESDARDPQGEQSDARDPQGEDEEAYINARRQSLELRGAADFEALCWTRYGFKVEGDALANPDAVQLILDQYLADFRKKAPWPR